MCDCLPILNQIGCVGFCGSEKGGTFAGESFAFVPHAYCILINCIRYLCIQQVKGYLKLFKGSIHLALDPGQVAAHIPGFRYPCLEEAVFLCFREVGLNTQAGRVGVVRPTVCGEGSLDFIFVRIVGEAVGLDSLCTAIGEYCSADSIFEDDRLMLSKKFVALLLRNFYI